MAYLRGPTHSAHTVATGAKRAPRGSKAPKDISSQAGAEAQAEALKARWAAQGYEIAAKAVLRPFVHGTRAATWGIETDLINGLPRGYRGPKQEIAA